MDMLIPRRVRSKLLSATASCLSVANRGDSYAFCGTLTRSTSMGPENFKSNTLPVPMIRLAGHLGFRACKMDAFAARRGSAIPILGVRSSQT